MNQENELPAAESSLCWTCKFGLCVQETEIEKILHPPMPDFPKMSDPFSADSEDEDEEMVGHVIEQERVKTICFWRPAGVENAPPILVALVNKCSRFDKRS